MWRRRAVWAQLTRPSRAGVTRCVSGYLLRPPKDAAFVAVESALRERSEPSEILSQLTWSLEKETDESTTSHALCVAVELLCEAQQFEAAATLVRLSWGVHPPVRARSGAAQVLDASLDEVASAFKRSPRLDAAALGALLRGFTAFASHSFVADSSATPDLVSLGAKVCVEYLEFLSAASTSVPAKSLGVALLPLEVATLLLQLAAESSLLPASPLWAELGYRTSSHIYPSQPALQRRPAAAAAAAAGQAHSLRPPFPKPQNPLSRSVVLAKKRADALRIASKSWRGPLGEAKAGVLLPMSPFAYLWQVRGGAWLWHESRFPDGATIATRRARGESVARRLSYVTHMVKNADYSVDWSGWLHKSSRVMEHARSRTFLSSVRLVPIDAHPAVDLPARSSDALRFAAALWREVTGRLICVDGVRVPPAGSPKPDDGFIAAMLRSCHSASDLRHLRSLIAADGIVLSGAALSSAVRWSVQCGDVMLARAFIEDATGKESSSSRHPVSSIGSAGDPSADTGWVESDTPVLSGSVIAAQSELVQACAACKAYVQAVSSYHELLRLGAPPTYVDECWGPRKRLYGAFASTIFVYASCCLQLSGSRCRCTLHERGSVL
jgi:hypothetical protein